jgi:hypothetical protein
MSFDGSIRQVSHPPRYPNMASEPSHAVPEEDALYSTLDFYPPRDRCFGTHDWHCGQYQVCRPPNLARSMGVLHLGHG